MVSMTRTQQRDEPRPDASRKAGCRAALRPEPERTANSKSNNQTVSEGTLPMKQERQHL